MDPPDAHPSPGPLAARADDSRLQASLRLPSPVHLGSTSPTTLNPFQASNLARGRQPGRGAFAGPSAIAQQTFGESSFGAPGHEVGDYFMGLSPMGLLGSGSLYSQRLVQAPPLQFHRWTEEEDRILLEHVKERGTRHWTQLRESKKLPMRDNKSCCNRFILLKKRYLADAKPWDGRSGSSVAMRKSSSQTSARSPRSRSSAKDDSASAAPAGRGEKTLASTKEQAPCQRQGKGGQQQQEGSRSGEEQPQAPEESSSAGGGAKAGDDDSTIAAAILQAGAFGSDQKRLSDTAASPYFIGASGTAAAMDAGTSTGLRPMNLLQEFPEPLGDAPRDPHIENWMSTASTEPPTFPDVVRRMQALQQSPSATLDEGAGLAATGLQQPCLGEFPALPDWPQLQSSIAGLHGSAELLNLHEAAAGGMRLGQGASGILHGADLPGTTSDTMAAMAMPTSLSSAGSLASFGNGKAGDRWALSGRGSSTLDVLALPLPSDLFPLPQSGHAPFAPSCAIRSSLTGSAGRLQHLHSLSESNTWGTMLQPPHHSLQGSLSSQAVGATFAGPTGHYPGQELVGHASLASSDLSGTLLGIHRVSQRSAATAAQLLTPGLAYPRAASDSFLKWQAAACSSPTIASSAQCSMSQSGAAALESSRNDPSSSRSSCGSSNLLRQLVALQAADEGSGGGLAGLHGGGGIFASGGDNALCSSTGLVRNVGADQPLQHAAGLHNLGGGWVTHLGHERRGHEFGGGVPLPHQGLASAAVQGQQDLWGGLDLPVAKGLGGTAELSQSQGNMLEAQAQLQLLRDQEQHLFLQMQERERKRRRGHPSGIGNVDGFHMNGMESPALEGPGNPMPHFW